MEDEDRREAKRERKVRGEEQQPVPSTTSPLARQHRFNARSREGST